MIASLNRRQAMIIAAGAATAAMLGCSAVPALAANDYQDLIDKFTGGTKPTEGRVRIDAPEIAENGNTVPLTIMVESPMTAQSYVADVLVVADDNPRPGVVTFHFTPDSGVAEAHIRIRLANTQWLHAVARMNDGSFFSTKKEVKVTIGGCGG
ncbi:MAG: thiosulfate oxidation carrier protein SoxY [Hyphomicrobiales bacterium]|nr:thiosulfate oxidation carrier protein SoxY [Hyphomicrobiales bacterium]